jgi:GT2 family glycosyltransferase
MILNLNGSRWLTGLYDSLRADGYENKRVYLVDNGSVDGSQQFTRDRYPEVSVIQMPRNLGYSMAYNAAAATAFADGCNWIVWQNNDTLVLPGWLDRFATAAADPRIGVMGAVFRDWDADGPNLFMQRRHRTTRRLLLHVLGGGRFLPPGSPPALARSARARCGRAALRRRHGVRHQSPESARGPQGPQLLRLHVQ